ncbi:low temperature requirement protein LtrA [Deinococcus sp. HSC-46F16]|uniref:low temperature requirement protein A n=1 Tax=Deinococcus sp. HSC-46F16 TaxID=2910968 RepID=UPI0020A1B9B9|nr:low temperature requirement protein A [Deinococcus sp. HSC-46F16]MCP2013875.1 low temperature requirement protein LtrA [Deinococcus sp. HSC-46F16]
MSHGEPSSVTLQDGPSDKRQATPGTPEEQKVTWLELFFDLTFVVAFDQLAKRLGDAPSGINLVNFLVMFGAVWWAWAGNTTFAARHGNQERVYRWGTLAQLLTVALMALSERGELAENGPVFAAAFAANRLILVAMHGLMIRKDPDMAAFARPLMTGYGLAALIWLGSAFLGGTVQLLAWGVALAVDLVTPLLIKDRHGHALPHQEHLPERVGLLQIIALGNIVTELVAGGRQRPLTLADLAPSFFALLAAVGLWRLYFDQARALPVLEAHRRGRVGSFLLWLYSHIPFTLGLVMLAVGMGHGISDTENARDAVNLQLVVWSLFSLLFSLVLLRFTALRLSHRRVGPDRSLLALLGGLLVTAGLSLTGLGTLPLHAAVAALTLGLAAITATDPTTEHLGDLEERLGAGGSPL